jgi:DegV family protein with EDD domain
MAIKIVTDSTCDLPQAVIDELDITVVPCYINFPERSYLDGVEITRQEFYEKLPNYNPPPTTSSPSLGTFAKTYKELIEKGADAVLSIHISSLLSGIYNVAELASEAIENFVIKTIDAGQLSLGTGLIVEAVAQAAKAGDSLEALVKKANDLKKRAYTFAAVDTLKYLQRSGRVSQLKALLGSMLQIKPILQMNQAKIHMGAARTFNGAVKHLVEILTALGPVERLSVVHTNAPDKAAQLVEIAKNIFPDIQNVYVMDVTPVLGAHLGPGTFGFSAITA